MALSPIFNGGYSSYKENDYVLRVSWGATSCYYDFMARTMMTVCGLGQTNMTTTPFSQLDREALSIMRDRLVELKGKPPELAPEAPATPLPAKKLNL